MKGSGKRNRVPGFRTHAAMAPARTRYKLWRSMRVLSRKQGGFTYAELCISADAGIHNAKIYLHGLLTAGYLERVGKMPGSGQAAIFRLVRDSGPTPPRVGHDGVVFDANLEGNR